MNALIVGVASALGREVAVALESETKLRRLDDCGPVEGPGEWVEGSLVNTEAMWRAVREIDVLIHTGESPPDLPGDSLVREEVLLDAVGSGDAGYARAIQSGRRCRGQALYLRQHLRSFSAYPERDQSQAADWGLRWAVYHICAPIPNPKFLLGRAEGIGYRPQRDFQGGVE